MKLIAQRISLAFVCMIASVLVVYALHIYSKIKNAPNGFARTISYDVISFRKDFDVKYNTYYIAGANANKIYLGNTVATHHMLEIAVDFSKSRDIELDAEDGKIAWGLLQCRVDSPFVYLMEGLTPSYLVGPVSSDKMSYYSLKTKFTACVPLAPRSLITRQIDPNLKQNVLTKNGEANPYTSKYILEKQLDGIFCTDGTLLYNRSRAQLFYIYHYRNQFVCLDTVLNVMYKGTTIDTTSQAKIILASLDKNTTTTFAAPPKEVNKKSFVSKNYLFINSGLKADNEDPRSFEKFTVIDIYNTSNGKYISSFYIPSHHGLKPTSFFVYQHLLFTIHGSRLAVFDIHLP